MPSIVRSESVSEEFGFGSSGANGKSMGALLEALAAQACGCNVVVIGSCWKQEEMELAVWLQWWQAWWMQWAAPSVMD